MFGFGNNTEDAYSMWVVKGSGTEDANGVYLECSNPSYSNTNGYIFKPNKDAYNPMFYKISNDGTVISQQTTLTAYSDRLRVESRYIRFGKDEEPEDMTHIIQTLTEEECKCIRDNHGSYDDEKDTTKLSISEFINKYHVTKQNIEWIRIYIQELKSYKTILYKKNESTLQWQCVDGKEPVPSVVEKLSNDKIPFVKDDNKQLTEIQSINSSVLNFNCSPAKQEDYKMFGVVFAEFLCNLAVDIYGINNVTSCATDCILDFLYCNHRNIGMVRIYEDTKHYFASTVRWVVFVCHTCHKQWSAPKMTNWYQTWYNSFPCKELMQYVCVKYPPQTMARGGCFGGGFDPENLATQFEWSYNERRSNSSLFLKLCDKDEMWKYEKKIYYPYHQMKKYDKKYVQNEIKKLKESLRKISMLEAFQKHGKTLHSEDEELISNKASYEQQLKELKLWLD